MILACGLRCVFMLLHPVSTYRRSHWKKQFRDPDVVGRVQNGTCQTRASEKMRYVNVKVHDNRFFFANVNKSSVPVTVPEQSEAAVPPHPVLR